jgi:hypothetical protein
MYSLKVSYCKHIEGGKIFYKVLSSIEEYFKWRNENSEKVFILNVIPEKIKDMSVAAG